MPPRHRIRWLMQWRTLRSARAHSSRGPHPEPSSSVTALSAVSGGVIARPSDHCNHSSHPHTHTRFRCEVGRALSRILNVSPSALHLCPSALSGVAAPGGRALGLWGAEEQTRARGSGLICRGRWFAWVFASLRQRVIAAGPPPMGFQMFRCCILSAQRPLDL